MDLHWLPLAAQIDHKIAVMTFKSLTTNQPAYLSELLQAHRPTRMLSSEQVNRLLALGLHSALLHQQYGTVSHVISSYHERTVISVFF
jgi:hypothetical protein